MTPNHSTQTLVFYDGACAVCNAEINKNKHL